MLTEAAGAASRKEKTCGGIQYRRLARRIEGFGATFPVARSILTIASHLVRDGGTRRGPATPYLETRSGQFVKRLPLPEITGSAKYPWMALPVRFSGQLSAGLFRAAMLTRCHGGGDRAERCFPSIRDGISLLLPFGRAGQSPTGQGGTRCRNEDARRVDRKRG